MNRRAAHLTALSSLLSGAAAFHLVHLILFNFSAPDGDLLGLLVWWGCLILTCLVLALFLRRERTLREIILICAGGFVLQLILTPVLGVRYPTAWGWFFALLMWGYLYYRCYALLCLPVKPEQLTLALEGSVAALFLAALFVAIGGMVAMVLPPLAIGSLLAILAMASLRTSHARRGSIQGQGSKGHGLLLELLTVFFALSAGVTALIIRPAARGVTWLTQWAQRAGLAVFQGIEGFLRWLASLFPQEDLGPMESEIESGSSIDISAGGEGAEFDPELLFLALAALVVLVIAAVLIWKLLRGGARTGAPALRGRQGFRQNVPFRQQLALLWQRMTAFVRFQLAYRRNYNTAPGLLVWLEKRFHREAGESPRAFLGRVAESCPEQGENLARLADCLDEHYFGAGAAMPSQEIAALRKSIKNART